MATFTCPHCGAPNSITGRKIPNDCPVNCSSCSAFVGLWGEVIGPAQAVSDLAKSKSMSARPKPAPSKVA